MIRFAPLLVLLICAGAASAEGAGDVLKLSPQLKSLKFAGDIRVREDYQSRKTVHNNDRSRARYRLRAGFEMEFPDQVFAAVRLGAGTGEQFSNNQTFSNLSSQKQIFVDQAYIRWMPHLADNLMVRLGGGKCTNWMWRVYSSDLIFDDDFNPESVQESVEWQAPFGVSLFANAMQLSAGEHANSARNQWAFSQQAGFEAKLPKELRFRTAAAYHKWSDENRDTFGQVGFNEGNRRNAAGTLLLNRFGVGEWTSELSGTSLHHPWRLQATLARNFRARGDRDGLALPAAVGNPLSGPAARDGYQFGAVLGRIKKQGDWELGLFKKYAQTDVTVADVSDSDFGPGGTNRVGGIGWLTYAIRDWMSARAKAFATKVIDFGLQPTAADENRFQLDLQVNF
ncbi:MAG: putative porin [Elusimicrobia bacterium]|nr:putative porin [Elusimicrobiota bacterium]